ncbi:hypothetical protein AB4Z19_15350 [Pseudoduganella sp. RAF19]|uniref:hypothetical protein n=1 Tax=Bacteria TaxID=2 RepID=UPI003F955EA2
MDNVLIKTSPNLLAAMQRAIHHKPTEDELRKQKISFIYGSLDKNSELPRESIQVVLDQHEGRTGK